MSPPSFVPQGLLFWMEANDYALLFQVSEHTHARQLRPNALSLCVLSRCACTLFLPAVGPRDEGE